MAPDSAEVPLRTVALGRMGGTGNLEAENLGFWEGIDHRSLYHAENGTNYSIYSGITKLYIIPTICHENKGNVMYMFK